MSPKTMRRPIDPVKSLYEFTVVGKGEFPFDMLRYDSCWPKSETRDAAMLAPYRKGEAYREGRRITLVGLREPTEGRWESFGWRVL